MLAMRAIAVLFAVSIPYSVSAENLLKGDVSAEAGASFLTHGRYSNELVPYSHDTGNGFHGKASVRVDWDAEKRYIGPYPKSEIHAWFDKFLSFDLPELDEEKEYTLSLYVKAETDNFPLILRAIPRTGWQYFAPNSFSKDKKEFQIGTQWQRISLTFKPLFKKESPIKAYSIILDFGKTPPGRIWYDAVQLEEGSLSSEFRLPNAYSVELGLNDAHWSHIYTAGEKVEGSVSLVIPEKCSLVVKVVDYQGHEIWSQNTAVASSGKQNFPLPSDRFGWFKVSAVLQKEAKNVAEHTQNYLLVKPPVKLADGIRPFCGVDDDPAFDNYRQLAKLGVKRTQVPARWRMGYRAGIENTPGVFDFSRLEFQLKRGREYGMVNKVLCGPFEVPSWYFDKNEWDDPERKNANLILDQSKHDAWTGLLREMMSRYGDLIDEIELGSEDNGQLGISEYYKSKYPEYVKPDAGGQLWLVAGKPFDDLCSMVISGAAEIRKHKPDMRIGAMRPSQGREGEHWFFVHKQFERIGKHFNIFPVDTYLDNQYDYGPLMDNSSQKNLLDGRFITHEHAKLLTRKYGIDQEVYISESGMFVDIRFPDVSEYRQYQAEMLVKDFIVSRVAGFTAYDYFQGMGGNVPPQLYNWFFQDNLKIQPHAAAYSAVAQIVENIVKSEYLKPDSKTRIAVMQKSAGAGVAAIWAEQGYIMKTPAGVRIEDMMGNAIPHQERLELSSAPILLFDESFDKLLEKMKQCEITQTNFCGMLFRRTGYNTGSLKVTNFSNRMPLDLEIVTGDTKQSLLIPAGAENVCGINVSDKTLTVEVIDLSKNGRMKQTFIVPELNPLHRNQSVVATVRNREDIHPQDDPWVSWNGADDLSAEISASWSEEALLLELSVSDDKHFNQFGLETWRGDSIQIGLDPLGDGEFHDPKSGKTFAPDDFEFGAALNNDGKEYFSGSHKLARIHLTRDENRKKTLYRIVLPWADLQVKPCKGMVFGMSFLIFDDDSGQGYAYYAPVGSGIAGFKSPANYKKFILED